MGVILAISSQVARGHIGLSAIVPALLAQGHEVWPLPTIVLSNHPGHRFTSGTRMDPDMLERMVGALDQNGWLEQVDAVLTGYLPSADHVHVAAQIVRRLRTGRQVTFLCDPVLGDHPKGLYLDPHAATALRNELLPLADVATPNAFELGWLAGTTAQSLADVVTVARHLGPADMIVTSAARQAGQLLNVHVSREVASACAVAEVAEAPHGTGDLFAGLTIGHVAAGLAVSEAMARAARGVALALAASAGHDELRLGALLPDIADAPPLVITRI